MKTKYKYIHFEREGQDWICRNNRSKIALGWFEYSKCWKQYTFTPAHDTEFSRDCLEDIIDFMKQLAELEAK